MRNMDHIELHRGGREEAFPETAEDWPYIAERAAFARYPGNSVPWHWHSEVELFYMEQGAIDYRTRAAHEHVRFEEGSAGFINGGVLHSTLQSPNSAPAIQMLHIFQPSMLGDPAGRLQKRYINPLLQCRGVDVLKWSPTNPDDMPFIDLLKSSFSHDLQRPQNEMALRNNLSELWIQIYAFAAAKGMAERNCAELTLQKKEQEKVRQRHTVEGVQKILDAETTPAWAEVVRPSAADSSQK